MCQITEKLRKAIDEKKYSMCVTLDLKKAFDTIDHSILASKLESYGVLGIVSAEADDKGDAGAGDGQASDQHGKSRVGHLAPQAAHLRHFIGVHGVDHRARTHEQQALEERGQRRVGLVDAVVAGAFGDRIRRTRYGWR